MNMASRLLRPPSAPEVPVLRFHQSGTVSCSWPWASYHLCGDLCPAEPFFCPRAFLGRIEKHPQHLATRPEVTMTTRYTFSHLFFAFIHGVFKATMYRVQAVNLNNQSSNQHLGWKACPSTKSFLLPRGPWFYLNIKPSQPAFFWPCYRIHCTSRAPTLSLSLSDPNDQCSFFCRQNIRVEIICMHLPVISFVSKSSATKSFVRFSLKSTSSVPTMLLCDLYREPWPETHLGL